ncbi:MAG: PaaI family thioesterase [Hyphomicrobiales bacterium]|nr:PaaI family thioesterase [Hyphomicrobiales bacterium]
MAKPADLYDLDDIAAVFQTLPHCMELGMEGVEIRRGECFLRIEYQDRLVGNPETGVVHGGVVTTLLDTAAGGAAFTLIPLGATLATLDMRIDYLKPATVGRAIMAYAHCYRLTSSIAFVRGVAYHETIDRPIANCAASFMTSSVGFRVDAPGAKAPSTGGAARGSRP